MATRLLGVFLILGAAAGHAQTIQHVTGNGSLTVGLDAAGRLGQIRWPGPASWDHLMAIPRENAENSPWAGWMVHGETQWEPLDSPAWDIRQAYAAADSLVITTHFEERGGDRSAQQRTFVGPGKDVLVVQLRLQGFAPETRIAWYQNLAPMTEDMARPTLSGPSVVPPGDFAAWYDESAQILTHFRPTAPGRADWSNARALSRGEDAAHGWADFGPGTYSCTASPNRVRRATVTSETVSLWQEIEPPVVESAPMATGRVHALLELTPEPVGGEWDVAIVQGWGPDNAAARATVEAARTAGPAQLLAMATRVGTEWLRGGQNIPTDGVAMRSVLNLLLCLDQRTGAVVVAPASDPALARVSVFDTVWASAALDTMGYTDSVARALDFLLDSVRTTGIRPPVGSLPAAMWPDGTTVAPDGQAEPASAVWILAGVWRHAMELPDESRARYLDEVWPKLVLCGDFLARDPVVGRALSGRGLSGAVPLSTLEEHYLGLESLRRVADLLGKPEVVQRADRRSELYTRIRIRRLNQDGIAEDGVSWTRGWIGTLTGLTESARVGWELLADGGALLPVPGEGVRRGKGTMVAEGVPHALRDALRCFAGSTQ